VAIPDFEYQRLKEEGKLNDKFNYIIVPSNVNKVESDYISEKLGDQLNELRSPINPDPTPLVVNSCNCLVPIDNTFSVAEFTNGTAPAYRNDDGSTAQKTIPFTFQFYGTNYTNFYINNNGNVSFGAGYTAFTSTGFPSNLVSMLAPFWADVDTRAGTNTPLSGLVYYKITPTSVIVKWDGVGYYNSNGITQGAHTEKLNTFQLIFTNGLDPILPPGNNVAFCYGDMQWTTGDVSGGTNGLGGTAATVGLNKGSGGFFAQIGRFSTNTAAFNGPVALNSGVNWLDNKSFYFDASNSTNIAPIVSGFNNCDTIKLCGANDTLILSGLFLSPEANQTTSVTIGSSTLPYTVLQNTTGNSASVQILILANPTLGGSHTITFTATDNGSPVGVSVVTANVYIDTTGLAAFNPVVSGTAMCQGAPTVLSVSPTNLTSYLWSNNTNGTSINVTTPGQYFVTSTLNGCSKTNIVDVLTTPAAAFTYNANTYCQTVQNINPAFAANAAAGTFSYTSSNGGTLVLNTSTGVVNIAGSSVDTYTVTNTIPAQLGCPQVISSFVFSITAANSATFVYSDPSFCLSSFGTNPFPLFNGGIGGTFSSSGGGIVVSPGSGQINLQTSAPGTYTITNTVTNGGSCPASVATTVVTLDAPQSATFNYSGSPYCQSGLGNVLPSVFGTSGVFYGSSDAPDLILDSITGAINIDSSLAGDYVITNIVVSNGVCPSAIFSTQITIDAPQQANFNYSSLVYCNNSANPSPIFVGNSVAGQFSSFPNGLVIDQSTGTIDLLGSTINTYTVINYVATLNSCPDAADTTTVIITNLPNASFTYAQSTYCKNGVNPAPLFNGGLAGIFSGSAGLVINSSTGVVNLIATPVGTYTITNTFAASGGCPSVTATAVITIIQPTATFTYSNTNYCQTGSTSPNITGTSGGTFSSIPFGLIINPSTGVINLQTSQTGNYVVTYSIVGSCPVTSTVSLNVNAIPASIAGPNQVINCNNATANLNGSGSSTGSNITYTWTNAGGTNVGNVSTTTVSSAGIYTLVVTNTVTGCSTSSTVTVTAIPAPNASFTANPLSGEAPLSVNFTNTSQNGVNYVWDFGDGSGAVTTNASNTFNGTGVYVVTLTASDNIPCTSTYTLTISVFDGYTMLVPNVFSPNGDGKNDLFKVTSTGVNSFDATIYDRWGLKMHTWTNPNEGWDGNSKSGQNAAEGTYFYIIKASGFDGVERELKGSLLLVK
jgi:gliding motility-associated-like protein